MSNRTNYYLSPPRLPRVAPVTVLHLCADNDFSGNPRRCFAVLTTTGRTVEVIDEGYGGESQVWARYPWFHHGAAHDLGITTAYAVTVDVAPAEYRRWIRQGKDLESDAPDWVSAHHSARRCARWSAVRRAVDAIRSGTAAAEYRQQRADAEGRTNGYAESDASGVTVYARTLGAAGDDASAHLHRALAALTDAGMLECLRANDTFGCYRATDTTPS